MVDLSRGASSPVHRTNQTEPSYQNARNIYLAKNGHVYAKQEPYQYRRNAKDSARVLHDEARNDLGPNTNVLEASSAGDRNLSAMTMPIRFKNGQCFTVEQLYQYGKVFKNAKTGKTETNASNDRKPAGLSSYQVNNPRQRFYQSLDAKRLAQKRNREPGNQLAGFQVSGIKFPLQPPSYFYDFLYMNALCQAQNRQVANKITKANAFSDVFSNPKKAVSTQAKSSALYSALVQKHGLEKTHQIISDPRAFKKVDTQMNRDLQASDKVLSGSGYVESQQSARQPANDMKQKQTQSGAKKLQPVKKSVSAYMAGQASPQLARKLKNKGINVTSDTKSKNVIIPKVDLNLDSNGHIHSKSLSAVVKARQQHKNVYTIPKNNQNSQGIDVNGMLKNNFGVKPIDDLASKEPVTPTQTTPESARGTVNETETDANQKVGSDNKEWLSLLGSDQALYVRKAFLYRNYRTHHAHVSAEIRKRPDVAQGADQVLARQENPKTHKVYHQIIMPVRLFDKIYQASSGHPLPKSATRSAYGKRSPLVSMDPRRGLPPVAFNANIMLDRDHPVRTSYTINPNSIKPPKEPLDLNKVQAFESSEYKHDYHHRLESQDEAEALNQKVSSTQTVKAQQRPKSQVTNVRNQPITSSKSKPSLAGANQELYLWSAFANVNSNGEPYVRASIRKRRDVNPSAPYAGRFVTEYKNRGRRYFNQYMTTDDFNRILKANGQKPMSKQDYVDRANAKRSTLGFAKDNLAFRGNIFYNRKTGLDLVNGKSIRPTDKPFNYTNERKLNRQAGTKKSTVKRYHVAKQQPRQTQPQNQSTINLDAGLDFD